MPAPDLHVVCLDPPWPPAYGGAIDQYYGLKALRTQGARLAVHVFYRSDRLPPPPPPAELGLDRVRFYRRSVRIDHLVGIQPFIIQSRRIGELYRELRADDRPIWFQGLHSTGWAARLRHDQSRRRLVLRVHNIETDYYAALAASEPRFAKRLFFRAESLRLRRCEARCWRLFDVLECISRTETERLAGRGLPADWLPAFLAQRPELPLPVWSSDALPVLFHADFRVAENELAGRFLAESLPRLPAGIRLTLAGRGLRPWPVPPQCQLVPNPPDMVPLLAAHPVVVLPVWRGAGVKLKLLDSIAAGRIVLATEAALQGSGFEGRVPQFADTEELGQLLDRIIAEPEAAARQASANRQYLLKLHDPDYLGRRVLADLGF